MVGRRIERDDDDDEKTTRTSVDAVGLLRRASRTEPAEDRRATRPGDQRVLEALRAHARHDLAAVHEEEPLLLVTQTVQREAIPFTSFDGKPPSGEDTVRTRRPQRSAGMLLALVAAVVFGGAFGLWFARTFL
jgi:hypothetical protein